MAGQRHREIERKYQVPDDFTLPDLTTVDGVSTVDEPVVHELAATYYDTDGLRLAAQRVTLRRRTGGTDAGWHVKLPAGVGERTEIQLPLGADADQVPREIVSMVRVLSRGEPLVPVARIRTRRQEWALRDGTGAVLALVADDQVRTETLDAAPEHRRWRELEVELVDGARGLLDAAEAAIRVAGARPASAPSKLARALGHRVTAPAERNGTARGALTAYLRAQRDVIVTKDAAVRGDEPEAVHDMRVATRRLRSTLRTFRPFFDRTRTDPLRDELKWLATVLGTVRDGEVMAARLEEAVAAESSDLIIGPVAARIRHRLVADTAGAYLLLIAALDSDRYLRLLRSLDELVEAPPAARVTDGGLRRRVRRALGRADDALEEAGTEDELLHEARKIYKAGRYAVEVLRPLHGEPAKRLASRLTDLQDVLGTHQDTIVTADLLRDYGVKAYLAGENAFSYGLLHGRQHEAGVEILRDLPRARREATRKRVRRWLL